MSFEADVVASFYDITVEDLLGGRRVLFLLFTFFAFLQLRHFTGDLAVLFFGCYHRSLEFFQGFAGKLGLFLFRLCLFDFADRVFDLCVGFGKDTLCLFLGVTHDLFPLFVYGFQILLVAGGNFFQLLFLLADILSLAFPIAFVTNDIL